MQPASKTPVAFKVNQLPIANKNYHYSITINNIIWFSFYFFVTGATCTTNPGTEYIYKYLFDVLFRYIHVDEIHHLDDYWLVFITSLTEVPNHKIVLESLQIYLLLLIIIIVKFIFSLGFAIYFGYGITHSKENNPEINIVNSSQSKTSLNKD